MERAIVILAAGRGKRMNSGIPKVLHKIAGAPMIMHTLRTAKTLDPERVIVITGHGAERVEKEISERTIKTWINISNNFPVRESFLIINLIKNFFILWEI